MVRYRILVVTGVGTGGWTSKMAADRVREELGKRGIKNVETKTCKVADLKIILDSWMPDAVITVIGRESDLNLPENLPVFNGVSLVSGVGMERVIDGIVEALKKPHWAGIDRDSRA